MTKLPFVVAPNVPKEVEDAKRVRLGGESPSFGPIRQSDR